MGACKGRLGGCRRRGGGPAWQGGQWMCGQAVVGRIAQAGSRRCGCHRKSQFRHIQMCGCRRCHEPTPACPWTIEQASSPFTVAAMCAPMPNCNGPRMLVHAWMRGGHAPPPQDQCRACMPAHAPSSARNCITCAAKPPMEPSSMLIMTGCSLAHCEAERAGSEGRRRRFLIWFLIWFLTSAPRNTSLAVVAPGIALPPLRQVFLLPACTVLQA